MNRQGFILGLAASALGAGAPVTSWAREGVGAWRVIILHPSRPVGEMVPGTDPLWSVFFGTLAEHGFSEGRNLILERRSALGREELHTELAREGATLGADVIFAVGLRLMLALNGTTTVPVVGITSDPVGHGLANSLARPGGRMTGVSLDAGIEVVSKRLQLLKEAHPAGSRIGYVAPDLGWRGLHAAVMEDAAKHNGITLVGPALQPPIQPAEYRRVIELMANAGAHALFISDYAENFTHREVLANLAAEHRLRAISSLPGYVDAGGLMEHAVDLTAVYRLCASYIARILSGAAPGELPFVQPTRYRLRVSLNAARQLGLTLAPAILAQADDVRD